MVADRFYQHLLGELSAGWAGLTDKPDETPETTLRALWHCAAGTPHSIRLAQTEPLPALNSESQIRLRALICRRLAGEPLAYLTGRQHFLGLELLASPQAMIPRAETEILARAAIERLTERAAAGEALHAADLCTGSGNVALAMAASVPACHVWGVDLCAEAVALANQNAGRLGLLPRVTFLTGDLYTPLEQSGLRGSFALVTCNPPYLASAQVLRLPAEIRQYEPHQAFDGGPYGMNILTRLIALAPNCLEPGGWLMFEVGLGQAWQILKRIQKNKAYAGIETYNDLMGNARVICAQTIASQEVKP